MTYIEPTPSGAPAPEIEPPQTPGPDIQPVETPGPDIDPANTPDEMPPLQPGGGGPGDSRPYGAF